MLSISIFSKDMFSLGIFCIFIFLKRCIASALDEKILNGILDPNNSKLCVFGKIRHVPDNETFVFNDPLCVDQNLRVYSCQGGLNLHFKKIFNCNNFVIQEQLTGKCLYRNNGLYFLSTCNSCMNDSFWNITNKCLKPNIDDAIGNLLCGNLSKNISRFRKNKVKPMCALYDLEKNLKNVEKQPELRKIVKNIAKTQNTYKNYIKKELLTLKKPKHCNLRYLLSRRRKIRRQRC